MAIRYRKEYKTWQVYWRNPVTQKQESKTFVDEQEAKKENSLILHRLKYEPESFALKPETQTPTIITLEQVYLEYICEKKFSKSNLAKHRSSLSYVLEHLGTRDIKTITLQDLEDVKQFFISSYSAATAHGRLCLFRTLMNYAASKGYIEAKKFPSIPSPHYKKFVPPTQEELAALFAVAPPHIQRVIILGAYFGVRIGQCELFQLTWEDVDLSKKILRIHGSMKNENAPWREVPIRQNLIPIFESWQCEDKAADVSYLISFRGKPVKSIKKAWSTAIDKAEIRHFRPYDLRHMFGTELVAAGTDIGTVAELMGHSSPSMLLRHYQFVMNKQKVNAVESLADLPSCMPRCMPQ